MSARSSDTDVTPTKKSEKSTAVSPNGETGQAVSFDVPSTSPSREGLACSGVPSSQPTELSGAETKTQPPTNPTKEPLNNENETASGSSGQKSTTTTETEDTVSSSAEKSPNIEDSIKKKSGTVTCKFSKSSSHRRPVSASSALKETSTSTGQRPNAATHKFIFIQPGTSVTSYSSKISQTLEKFRIHIIGRSRDDDTQRRKRRNCALIFVVIFVLLIASSVLVLVLAGRSRLATKPGNSTSDGTDKA